MHLNRTVLAIAAEKTGRKIAVEVKSFIGGSGISD
ncbi:MAG: element excision factor XisH family protein [Aulosira sp. ZfuVER01]|nr:element excision factor XisH family protein [Aulosira sp. ZfuVER01]MDZ7999445.1 element excision factor XisH family protein [Aulosira sp. DedVER01a]MDZ8054776.1 element excision factor XisH family protein [Aulosira sp. ZfuCHP01]